MAASKSKAKSQSYGKPPEKLEAFPFYGYELDDEQLEFANTIWNKDIDIVFVCAKAGTGKAQPVDTAIPTPNGFVKLGDLKVGDYVFDRNGNPTRVLGVYPQGKQRAYKVSLSDGRSTICAGEHLWSYYSTTVRNRDRLITETLHSMMGRKIQSATNSTNRYAIPLNFEVNYSEKDLPVHPYVVGAFLGDGCCTEKHLALSSEDDEIPQKIASLIDARCVRRSERNYTWDFVMGDNARQMCMQKFDARADVTKWQTKWLFANLPELIGKCYEKRIPKQYLEGSIKQRYELLQGLFDTDGSIVRHNDRYRVTYHSVNKELAQDVVLLINSLGYSANISESTRAGKRPEYTVYARVANADKHRFFSIERKRVLAAKAMKSDNYHKYDRIQISKIEDLGYECDMVCIYVDNPDHLYLTNDYIVTHNTTVATGVANLLVKYGFYKGIVYIMSPYGERKQGWLPGTITEKSSVYFEAFYQALVNCDINPATSINDDSMVNQKNGSGYITCITDTFLRGSTLDNAVVIIDEAQNYTTAQLKKTLTRIGNNSKVIVVGHDLQCDLDDPSKSGFIKYLNHFADKERAAVCKLTTNHRSWISQYADELEE